MSISRLGNAFAHVGDGARHHHIGDARHRGDLELDAGAALDPGNNELQILDLVVDAVDLVENRIGFPRRAVAAASAVKQLDPQPTFRRASLPG